MQNQSISISQTANDIKKKIMANSWEGKKRQTNNEAQKLEKEWDGRMGREPETLQTWITATIVLFYRRPCDLCLGATQRQSSFPWKGSLSYSWLCIGQGSNPHPLEFMAEIFHETAALLHRVIRWMWKTLADWWWRGGGELDHSMSAASSDAT